jgi:hypothetical protein
LVGEDGAHETDQGIAVGEDPDDVGAAADLPVEAFLLRVVELSNSAEDVRGDGRKPLNRSQTAKTISWTAMGRIRNA